MRITDVDSIAEKIVNSLSQKHAVREQAFKSSRDIVRRSANAIRAGHRGEFDKGRKLVAEAGALLTRIKESLREHSDILHSGFVHDAEKEYTEANITLAMMEGKATPDPDELGVGYAPYLNGLGETIGELRRHLLDSVRGGDLSRCEDILSAMDDIYSVLVSVDFPDAITGGLRRTTDVARSIIEKTRGDLTLLQKNKDLERKIDHLSENINKMIDST